MSASGQKVWAAGLEVGRYVLERLIARGGMAEIWLARQPGPGDFLREVVIKRILPESAAPEDFRQLFFDEARVAAQLTHPNIVQVYGFDEFEGTPYLVMEALRGETLMVLLRAAVERGLAVQPKLAVAIIERCARALGSAHRKTGADGKPLNVVHRDVSPQNIFITTEGVVKVLDFGIARAVGRVTKTSVGMVRGKPQYMAPEQALGEAVAASDVFSLGIVLFELLTARRPYGDADHLTVFSKLVGSQEELPSPAEVNPAVPPQLDQLVRRMLARQPARRFEDGVACAEALEQWQRTNQASVSEHAIAEWVHSLDRAAAPTIPVEPVRPSPASTAVESPAGSARRGKGSSGQAKAAPPLVPVSASDIPTREAPPVDVTPPTRLDPLTAIEAPVPAPVPSAPTPATKTPVVRTPVVKTPDLRRGHRPKAPPGLSTGWKVVLGSAVVVALFVVGALAARLSAAPPLAVSPPAPEQVVLAPPPPPPPPPPPLEPLQPLPEAPLLELKLSSKPSDAQVEVDGVLVGRTPTVVTGRDGAVVSVVLSAQGYERLERRVLLSPKLAELTLELSRARPARQSVKPTQEKPKPGLYDSPWE